MFEYEYWYLLIYKYEYLVDEYMHLLISSTYKAQLAEKTSK